ncbi:TRAP transporter small permease [Chondrinema litorale]|uniref:TRAP transporter small permease n=1 Tax=Chondrinema litorale TaxID=2994555 RepID=UPI0025434CC1|nr:TRAP transporter small permease [Chondrinema litorale]UZR92871.1 TRAP transporter small permease [Chondrinema litorale]
MKEKIDSLLGKTLTVIMGLMVLNVLLQVFARFMRIQVDFTEEVAGFLLIWVGLLGASYATGKGMHLAIDLLPRSKSVEAQKKFNIVINLIVLLFALSVMVIGGFRLVYITLSLNQLSPVLEIPKGYIYLVLPLSGFLIMYYSIINMKKENPFGE